MSNKSSAFLIKLSLFISGTALCIVTSSHGKISLLSHGIAVCLVLMAVISHPITLSKARAFFKPAFVIPSVLISCIIGIRFYKIWFYSNRLEALSERIGINYRHALMFCDYCGVLASIPFLVCIIGWLYQEYSHARSENSSGGLFACEAPHITALYEKAYIGIVDILSITFASKSSILYPFNDWVDSNCFFTVGKGIAHGLVPYKDLYEQKGPLLYMLHTLAYYIDNTGFLGVYFLELIACFFFLWFSYKSILLYCHGKEYQYALIMMPLIAFATYGEASFCHGDSAEELCLPILAYCLYTGLQYLRSNGEQNIFSIGFRIGVAGAAILWIKYTILGLLVGLVFTILLYELLRLNWNKIALLAAGGISGLFAASLPIIFYFAANNALGDLFETYFYNNIFIYGSLTNSSFISKLHSSYNSFKSLMPTSLKLISVGLVGILCSKISKIEKVCLIVCAFSTFVFAGIGTTHKYYWLVLAAFNFTAVIVFVKIISLFRLDALVCPYIKGKRLKCLAAASVVALSAVYIVLNSTNTYLLFANKEDMPQYKFAKIIQQSDDASLLNYGFLDGGFYTVSDVVPSGKFFCTLNIHLDEMYNEMNRYIDEGLTEFVVTRGSMLDSPNYTCIATEKYYFEGGMQTYYLHKRN